MGPLPRYQKVRGPFQQIENDSLIIVICYTNVAVIAIHAQKKKQSNCKPPSFLKSVK